MRSIRVSCLNHLNVGHSRQVRCFKMSKLPRVRLPSLVLECIQNSGRTGYAQPRIGPPRKEGRKRGRTIRAGGRRRYHRNNGITTRCTWHRHHTIHQQSTWTEHAAPRFDRTSNLDVTRRTRNCRCLRGGRCDARVFFTPNLPLSHLDHALLRRPYFVIPVLVLRASASL